MGRNKPLPKKIIYLELLDSLFDQDAGSSRARARLRHDFPWIESDRWAIERWGLRNPKRASDDANVPLCGLTLPFRVFPRVLLPALVWITQFALALLRPRAGIMVAYTPLAGTGVAAARLLRRGSGLIVRIIDSGSSRARFVYRRPVEARILAAIEGFVLRRADVVIPMAGYTRGIARAAGVAEHRIVELPYQTRWSGTKIDAVDDEGPLRVICAGRLVPEKGFDLLILAFADVAREFPKVMLEVAGDGPERGALEQLAHRLGIDRRVKFHGWLAAAQMPSFLTGALVAVLPSRVEEGFPTALVEAGLAGCALIGTNLGGIRDIVQQGRTGVLVPPNDPLCLADAVIDFLQDPSKARRLGTRARARSLGILAARDRAMETLQLRIESLRLGTAASR